MSGIPDYRTPEWREVAERGASASDAAGGIDEAMQWAYDLGLGAGAEYARLEAQLRRHPAPATGTDAVTHFRDWPAGG